MFATSFKVSVLQRLFFFIVLKLHRTHLCWQFVMTRMFTIPITIFTKKREKEKKKANLLDGKHRTQTRVNSLGWLDPL